MNVESSNLKKEGRCIVEFDFPDSILIMFHAVFDLFSEDITKLL
jgi:hypothetical protein